MLAPVNWLPLPVVQEPLSILYSQAAPASRPLTLTMALLVIASLLLLPVSLSSASVGAAALRSTNTLPLVLAVAFKAAPDVPVTDTLMS